MRNPKISAAVSQRVAVSRKQFPLFASQWRVPIRFLFLQSASGGKSFVARSTLQDTPAHDRDFSQGNITDSGRK